MDIATLAEHICCSTHAIDTWIKQGIFPPPSKVLGSKRLWSWAEVDDCLHRKCVTLEVSGMDLCERIYHASKTVLEAENPKARTRSP